MTTTQTTTWTKRRFLMIAFVFYVLGKGRFDALILSAISSPTTRRCPSPLLALTMMASPGFKVRV
jgi:hypothetical protein